VVLRYGRVAVVGGEIGYVVEVVEVDEGFGYVAEGGREFVCMTEVVVEDWC
jgi:hypothetical protein